MTSLTKSEQLIALVPASTALPLMLLALWAGAAADRFDRRHVMFASQVFTILVSAALALFAWAGSLGPWSLLGFTFLIGCGNAIKTPAWQAGVGEMVPRPALPAAIALNSVGFNLARSVGPAIGGAIVAIGGPPLAFLVNAISSIGMLAALGRWRPQHKSRTLPPEPFLAAMMAGIRYVAMTPAILAVLPRAALFGLAASSVQALLPLIVRDRMHGDALTYGLLLGAFGLGAVLGGLLIGKLRRRLAPKHLSRISAMTFVVGTIGVALSPWLATSLVALALNGAGWIITLSTMNVTVQLNAPNWVLARTLALYQMAAFGGIALGSWLSGLLADHYGVRDALLISAALQLAVLALTFWLRFPAPDQVDFAPVNDRNETNPLLTPEHTGLPVVIVTEFRIPPENRAEFLTLMQQRRRIRGRNGARRWELLHDLSDPEVWIETFHVPAWSEYLRHRERLVQHEVQLFTRIRHLDRRPNAPLIRRFVSARPDNISQVGAETIDLA
jgi:MFS family permease